MMVHEVSWIMICIQNPEKLESIVDYLFDDYHVVVTNNPEVKQQLHDMWMEDVILLGHEDTYIPHNRRIRQVIIIDDVVLSILDTIERVKMSVQAPIMLITKNKYYPFKFYELMGIHYVMMTNYNQFPFLLRQRAYL
ncbi:hypothetical protein [Priestia koreensis]|uniref:hypothetical protein n=1 Tax=Priestia koreensis TaxID=284581 RepID=UPI00203D5E35|nr:hypothetical protein [Priestia koreensis]MCM3004278.1 hypothetical protein [Priestia koreensis]